MRNNFLIYKWLSLIHISEPTRQAEISYAVFCLKKNPFHKALSHCFSSNLDFAKKLIAHGIKISFSGNVTFKNATNIEVVENISLDDFMLETDCPFLAPHPYRGSKNEPKYVLTIAEKIAELRGETLEQIALSTSKNAKQFFNI